MVLAELLPAVQALPTPDKRRLLQLLADDLAGEDGPAVIPPGDYPFWSPYDSYEAAAAMLRYLETNKARP